MTAYNLKISRFSIAVALPLLLAYLLILFSFSRFFAAHSYKLSIGVTFDLVFTVPLLHILLTRKHRYSKYTASLFFTAGLLIAGFVIPKNNQYLLHGIKLWLVPVMELLVITFLVIKTRQVYATTAISKNRGGDFYDTLKMVTTGLLPKRLAAIICAEVGALYYGFVNWRKPAFDQTTFSYHKKTSTLLIIGVFIFMILVETTVFHLLLAKWSTKAAWVLSGISLYAVIQALGIAKSICKRPVRITALQLIVPYGLLAETSFDLQDIAEVAILDRRAVTDEHAKYLSPLNKIEEPNVVIRLKKSYMIDVIYGAQKPFETLLIFIDEKDGFVNEMSRLIN